MGESTKRSLEAIFTRLEQNSTLLGIVQKDTSDNGIYGSVPQQSAYPYCLVEIESVPFKTFDKSNQTHTIRVHGFSRKGSPGEAMDIAEQIFISLDRQESNVNVANATVVELQYNGLRDTFKEPDGKTWHSVIEFKMIVEDD